MNTPAKSGHTGIQLRAKSGLYRARIRIFGKMHEVGEFVTIEEAVEARREFYERMVKLKESIR